MKIERTNDPRLVRSIICDPGVKPFIWEEGEPPVLLGEDIYCLIASDGDAQMAVVLFVPMNGAAWSAHIAVLPVFRGRGESIMKAAMAWMFQYTPCVKVCGEAPEFNARVLRLFEKCGMRMEGFSPMSFPWHGELHGRFLLGIEKGALCLG